MTGNKRSKVDIYSAILDGIYREGEHSGSASPTRVARRANLPYDRFQKIIDNFLALELIQKTNEGFLITEKGKNCLAQIRKTNEFLRRMGLSV